MKRAAAVATTVLAGMAMATAVASPAAAGPNGGPSAGNGPRGPEARVKVVFSGNVKPGGGGTRTVSIPAVCWWEPIPVNIALGNPPVDPSDPESVKKWVEEISPALSGHAAVGRTTLPTGAMLEDVIRRVAAGEDLTWYTAECVEGESPIGNGLVDQTGEFQGFPTAILFQAFPTGDPAPPAIAAEDLALEAVEVLDTEAPEIERNPVIEEVAGGTLVDLPTWFWVNNDDQAVGGPDGQISVTATVPGSPVEATVTASSTGLTVTSPSGGSQCTPEQARVKYGPGADEEAACTVAFDRASVGYENGYPVQATTNWDVEWDGVEANGDGAEGGLLDDIVEQAVVQVPVAESQAIVTRGD